MIRFKKRIKILITLLYLTLPITIPSEVESDLDSTTYDDYDFEARLMVNMELIGGLSNFPAIESVRHLTLYQ